jgi:hypothetical protein
VYTTSITQQAQSYYETPALPHLGFGSISSLKPNSSCEQPVPQPPSLLLQQHKTYREAASWFALALTAWQNDALQLNHAVHVSHSSYSCCCCGGGFLNAVLEDLWGRSATGSNAMDSFQCC